MKSRNTIIIVLIFALAASCIIIYAQENKDQQSLKPQYKLVILERGSNILFIFLNLTFFTSFMYLTSPFPTLSLLFITIGK